MHKIKEIFKKKSLRHFSYFLLTAIMILFLWSIGEFFNINRFLEITELRTLDFRVNIPVKTIKHNPKFVILAIDDDSLELLENEYGRWPWSREIYTNAINYLEKDGVDSMAFDLMFLGYQKGFENRDLELAKSIGKYNNIFISMNFDNRDNMSPPELPNKFKLNVDNQNPELDFSDLTFSNCRLIFKEMIDAAKNIGITNLARDEDGITRHSPLFIKYQNEFYPYLASSVAFNYLKNHENVDTSKFTINKKNQLILGKRKIQLDNNGLMLVNWYGPDRTFEYIPFWKVIKSINNIREGKLPVLPYGYFKDKVVFVGVTAISLYDIKTTPTSSIFPGVEVQSTIFNNIIDGNPIKKVDEKINFLICVLLSIITGISVIKIRSSFTSSFINIMVVALYILLASILLKNYFIWIGIVHQVIVATLTFTFMYIIKYLMKSRDFEYTYKLATTDGLTNLHNHRFFQEHLVNSIERAKRYKAHFSLLLIDIDFFKKFNDTYGHQAGDAVLRQVAETLKKTVRSSDLVARYGGEEMAIVLDNVDIDEAISIANKVCNAVASRHFRLSETIERHVTVSLGVAAFPQHGETPSELIEFADQGLYKAKESGRNQVGRIEGHEYNPDLDYLSPDQV